jgi:crotonobetainyl-CoA:carnitine CoA-transferase CaiB-like acyl-CoA transferase
MERISAQGVPCGATLDSRELLANEQLLATGMVFDARIPGWGDVRMPGCPIVIDGQRPRPGPAPELNADGGEPEVDAGGD